MWSRLSQSDLALVLSQDEIDRVSTLSLSSSISAVVQDTLDLAADTYRGAFYSKGYAVDIRDHYVPSPYKQFVLVYARQILWSRFPNSNVYALDEIRKEEQKTALAFLKNPSIGTGPVEWEYSSDNPANGSNKSGSITIPFLRFNEDLLYFANQLSIDLF